MLMLALPLPIHRGSTGWLNLLPDLMIAAGRDREGVSVSATSAFHFEQARAELAVWTRSQDG